MIKFKSRFDILCGEGRLGDFPAADSVNSGLPSLLILGGGMAGFSGVSVPLASSVVLPWLSKSDALMMTGFGFWGVIPFATPRNGKGCNEQTILASTATERRSAHKSWALRSRESVRRFVFDNKFS